jgi:hypothetical protein
MGIRFVVKNGDFAAKAINYVPPVAAGLEYLNFFGGEANLSRNLAPGKPAGQVIGSPAFTDKSMTPTQMSKYIQTLVPHTDEMTIMAVAKGPADDADSHLVSNYFSPRAGGVGTAAGVSVMTRQTSPVVDGVARDTLAWSHWDGVSSPTVLYSTYLPNRPVPELKTLVATTSKATRLGKIYNKTAGLVASSSPISDGKTPDLGGLLRIGSAYTTVAGYQPSEIFFVAIWSRVLTEVEIDVMYEAVKGYYANRGIPV